MKAILYYILQVIAASGILYAYYHIALKNKKFHRYNRFYLLAATMISIIIPFLNIPVYFLQSGTDPSFVQQTLRIFSSPLSGEPVIKGIHGPQDSKWFTWQNLSYLFYALIASVTLLRVILSLLKIRRIAKKQPR